MQFVKWILNCSSALNELNRGGVNTQADRRQFVKWMPNCSSALNEVIRGGVNTQADLKGQSQDGSSTKRTSA